MKIKSYIAEKAERLVEATATEPNSGFPYGRMLVAVTLCAGIVWGTVHGIEKAGYALGNKIYSTENKSDDNMHPNSSRLSLDYVVHGDKK